jgi:C4-dicarboxylate-specific signal transduction histidine kinase
MEGTMVEKVDTRDEPTVCWSWGEYNIFFENKQGVIVLSTLEVWRKRQLHL